AIGLLKERLKHAGWDGRGSFRLGHENLGARQIDKSSQINIKNFGSTWDVADDMYGALGFATLKVGVIGEAVEIKNRSDEKPRFFSTFIRQVFTSATIMTSMGFSTLEHRQKIGCSQK
ncbi:DUF6402 family protein, partial [Pseudomonas tremae]|uniref:DUF6402 family protein n=1 Tax=Pseudomonas tremae TaxID=200454 RepID=UPI001F38131D